MNIKYLFGLFVLCSIITSCSPSEEKLATQVSLAITQTAGSWTSTPTTSPTPTTTSTPIPTSTNTPTPTPIPLTDLDFHNILLQESDLPTEYRLTGQAEGHVEMSNLFRDSKDVQGGMIDGAAYVFSVDKPTKEITLEQEDYQNLFNGVFIYKDEEAAKRSFQALRFYFSNATEFSVPKIGDESAGLNSESINTNFMVSMSINFLKDVFVIWRYKEAVYFINYQVMNPPENDLLSEPSTLIKLANNVHLRTLKARKQK